MPLNTVLHERRRELGLTQEQIAEYLGVSTPAINKWEKRSSIITLSLPVSGIKSQYFY